MEKEIYRGCVAGLYCYGKFEQFMESKKGAEHIRSRFDTGNNLFQIWMLQDAVVHYKNNSNDLDGKVSVVLYGNSDNIRNVENIILEEAKKY